MTLTPSAPNQTHKPKTGREKLKESALLVNGGRVERPISKEKPIYAILMFDLPLVYIPQPFIPYSDIITRV